MTVYPDVKSLIPHSHPFVMVDNIVDLTCDFIVTEKTFQNNDYGTRDNFVLEGILIEAAAQTVAAKHGFDNLSCDKKPGRGMLVSIGNLDFFSRARTNIPLKILAQKQTEVGKFTILSIFISQDNFPVARGTLQLFMED